MIASLLSKLPESRPADWGFNVTVCIAALCEHRSKIVSVSDSKVGFGDFSADMGSIKNVPFYREYFALVAGNDVEHANPILIRANELLVAGGKDKSPLEVANAVDDAYGERLQSEISRKVLRKRGFTVDTFMEKGKQKCTPSVYLSLCNRIDQVSFSLKFLVGGFDQEGKGHLYAVNGEGAPKNYNSIGLWAIGSGSHAALSSLAYFVDKAALSFYKSEEITTYFAITAKFMAESSESVGRIGTFVCVTEKDKSPKYVNLADVETIRKLWNAEGAPRVPKNIDTTMEACKAKILSSG